MTSLSEIVTIEDVSAALGTSPTKVKDLCRKHSVPVIKIGHQIRFTKDAVDRLLDSVTWHYQSGSAVSTTTQPVQFRGETKVSSYDKLQAALNDQKRAK